MKNYINNLEFMISPKYLDEKEKSRNNSNARVNRQNKFFFSTMSLILANKLKTIHNQINNNNFSYLMMVNSKKIMNKIFPQ